MDRLCTSYSRIFVFFGLFLLSTSLSAQESTQDGLQLFGKKRTALGGEAKIGAIKDYEEVGVGSVFSNSGRLMGQVRKRTRWIKSNHLRLDQQAPAATYVLYFDGTSGWEILPDVERRAGTTTGQVIDLAGDELQFARGYLRDFMSLWFLGPAEGISITAAAPNVIRIANGSTVQEITLDTATWHQIKQTTPSADPSKPPTQETTFSDWKEVSGVLFPVKKANYHNGNKLAEGTLEMIGINSGMSPRDLAEKPADRSPIFPTN
jgi:hypothetical protein